MSRKLIVFSHHRRDNFTRWSFERAKQFNPDWDVKPIGFSGYDLLPGSSVASKEKYPSNKVLARISRQKEDWCDPDLLLHEAFAHFPDYDEYFLHEYDTVCNTSIESFFNSDVDFFCNSKHGNRVVGNWNLWVRAHRRVNYPGIEDVYTVGQMTCLYFKRHILEKCFEEITGNPDTYNGMLSEIRTGTIVKKFTDIKMGRADIADFIDWRPFPMVFKGEYYFHPVKDIIPD